MKRASTTTRAVGVAAGALCLLMGSDPAGAYVRTRTDDGAQMCWCSPSTLKLQLLTQTAPPSLGAAVMTEASNAAAAVWSQDAVSCSQMTLEVVPASGLPATVMRDDSNRVFFRKDSWKQDSAALAITNVFAIRSNGKILDADVEINAVHFNWGDLIANPTAGLDNAQDLQNTLTHEFGHVIGLDHPCTATANATDDEGRPFLDENGTRAPACNSASAVVRDTTMFASVRPGDTERRTLAADDVKAVCAIYPSAGPLNCPCEDPGNDGKSSGGCSYGGPAAPIGPAALLLAGLAWLGLRRRNYWAAVGAFSSSTMTSRTDGSRAEGAGGTSMGRSATP